MTSSAPSFKLLLVADTRPLAPEPARVPLRRYRLARLRLERRSTEPSRRFDHLKRIYE